MTTPRTTTPTTTARTTTRGQLLTAARLGAAVAAADLAGRPDEAAAAYASWRRLRGRAGRRSRQLLRIAFDTGYGRGMQPDVHMAALTPSPR